MVDQDASFYLMVVLAMSDQEIHEKEATEIKEITDKFNIKFDPYFAAQEISEKFGNYFSKYKPGFISVSGKTFPIEQNFLTIQDEGGTKKIVDKVFGQIQDLLKEANNIKRTPQAVHHLTLALQCGG